MPDRQTIADVEEKVAGFALLVRGPGLKAEHLVREDARAELHADLTALLASHRKMREEHERFRTALGTIAEGTVPPPKHGHYLAHRAAVKLARQALQGDADAPR